MKLPPNTFDKSTIEVSATLTVANKIIYLVDVIMGPARNKINQVKSKGKARSCMHMTIRSCQFNSLFNRPDQPYKGQSACNCIIAGHVSIVFLLRFV